MLGGWKKVISPDETPMAVLYYKGGGKRTREKFAEDLSPVLEGYDQDTI